MFQRLPDTSVLCLDYILHSIAVALDNHGFGVVKEAIQQRRSEGAVVIEDFCHHRLKIRPLETEKMGPRTKKGTSTHFRSFGCSYVQGGWIKGNHPVYVLFNRLSSRAFGLLSIDTPFQLVRTL